MPLNKETKPSHSVCVCVCVCACVCFEVSVICTEFKIDKPSSNYGQRYSYSLHPNRVQLSAMMTLISKLKKMNTAENLFVVVKIFEGAATLFGWVDNRRMVQQSANDCPEQHSTGLDFKVFPSPRLVALPNQENSDQWCKQSAFLRNPCLSQGHYHKGKRKQNLNVDCRVHFLRRLPLHQNFTTPLPT